MKSNLIEKKQAYQELVAKGENNPSKSRVKNWCDRRNMIITLNEQGFDGEFIINRMHGSWI